MATCRGCPQLEKSSERGLNGTFEPRNNKNLIRRRDSERELFTTTSHTHYSPQQSSLRLWKAHMSISAK